jgi:hypothetical protein
MMLMNITPDKKDLQPTQKTETTTTWQDCVVEELDDKAQAAVVGGAKGGYPGKDAYPDYGYLNYGGDGSIG